MQKNIDSTSITSLVLVFWLMMTRAGNLAAIARSGQMLKPFM